MKFLIIGDLHGSMPKIKVKGFDYIIAPGDFCSDKYERKLWKEYFKYQKFCEVFDKKPLDFTKFIKKFMKIKQSDLKKYNKYSLNEGRKILKFLNSFNKPVLIVPGNWDQSYKEITASKKKEVSKEDDPVKYYNSIHRMYSSRRTNKFLTTGLKNIKDCQLKLINFKEFQILGYGLSSFPEIPDGRHVKSKKKYNLVKKGYDKLFSMLVKESKKRDKTKPLIFLTHNVPYNTKLDKIENKQSPVHGEHYGSKIARDFCRKYQPLICIGAHMHEHFGKDKIGKTVCINSGFGSNVNVLLEINENKITKLKFMGKTKSHT